MDAKLQGLIGCFVCYVIGFSALPALSLSRHLLVERGDRDREKEGEVKEVGPTIFYFLV